jgi:hypothetical protein
MQPADGKARVASGKACPLIDFSRNFFPSNTIEGASSFSAYCGRSARLSPRLAGDGLTAGRRFFIKGVDAFSANPFGPLRVFHVEFSACPRRNSP